jgi:hypothetical protein
MKKIMFLMLGLGFLLTACEKNDVFYADPEVDGMLKSAEVKMVPLKAEFQSIVTEYNEGVPVKGLISGKMSHLGKLVTEKSIFNTTDLTLDESTWTITWEMSGTSCAANGDLLFYSLSGTFSIPENKLTAHVIINGGTGRFEFAQGCMDVTGYADDPAAITTMYMKGEGFISNVGSKK